MLCLKIPSRFVPRHAKALTSGRKTHLTAQRTFPSPKEAMQNWEMADGARTRGNLQPRDKRWAELKLLISQARGAGRSRMNSTHLDKLFRQHFDEPAPPDWARDLFDTFPRAKELLAVAGEELVIAESLLDLPPESIDRALLELGDYSCDPTSIEHKVLKDYPESLAQEIQRQLDYKKVPREPICPIQSTEQLLGLIEQFKIHPGIYTQKLNLVKSIIKTLKKNTCNQTRIHLTGNETALHFSDIDIKVTNFQYELTSKVSKKLLNPLQKLGLTDFVFVNSPRKRVPLIKCRHADLDLDVDIVFKDDHSLVTTQLFKSYALLHPTVRNLLLLVKIWAHSRMLNAAFYNSLNSSSLMASLLAYLISVGVIPNLQTVCRDHVTFFGEYMEGATLAPRSAAGVCTICRGKLPGLQQDLGWYFNDRIKLELDPGLNEHDLLLGYFRFMTQTFHRSYHAISMQAGGLIPLDSIAHKPGGLTITDPFDLNDNLARATVSKSAHAILWEMRRAEHLLQTAHPMDAFSTYTRFPPAMYVEHGIYPSPPR